MPSEVVKSIFLCFSLHPLFSQTYIPLATVLLAISEQTLFLNNWHVFLVQNLLPSLRVGLERWEEPSTA